MRNVCGFAHFAGICGKNLVYVVELWINFPSKSGVSPKEVIDFPHTHNRCVDWWALGVLTYECLRGRLFAMV